MYMELFYMLVFKVPMIIMVHVPVMAPYLIPIKKFEAWVWRKVFNPGKYKITKITPSN